MPFLVYKVLHLLGLMLGFTGYGMALTAGGTQPGRKRAAMVHGTGVLLLLIAGFGMLARLGIMSSLPAWALIKAGLWLCFGGGIVLANRKPQAWSLILLAVLLIGGLAAWAALYKPFS